jgi:hypothetical protein
MPTFIESGSLTMPQEGLMTKRIRTTEPTVARIRATEAPLPRIDPQTVAAALGAEPVPEHIEGQPGPFTLYALRQELLRRRHSTGGRPGIEGTDLRAKIPLADRDWQCLESLAAALTEEGFAPSPGQVGSVLLSIALRSLTEPRSAAEEETSGSPAALSKELAARLEAETSR